MNKSTITIIIAGAFIGWIIWLIMDVPVSPSRQSQPSYQNVEADLTAGAPFYLSQTDSRAAVDVTVTPRDLSVSASVWEFEVALETHSVELDMDVAAISTLEADGKLYPALAWQGSPPGGHHRSGVLTFSSVPSTEQITVRIQGVGNRDTREFHWEL